MSTLPRHFAYLESTPPCLDSTNFETVSTLRIYAQAEFLLPITDSLNLTMLLLMHAIACCASVAPTSGETRLGSTLMMLDLFILDVLLSARSASRMEVFLSVVIMAGLGLTTSSQCLL